MAKEKKTPWWFLKREERPSIQAVPDYTIVSTVSGALVELLRSQMVPQLLEGRDRVGLCSPLDHRDITLGVWLYDLEENDQLRINEMISYEDSLQYPPMYLNLHYMITVYSEMDLRYKSEEEHRLLAKTMQVLRDHSVLDSATLKPAEAPGDYDLHIEYQNFPIEEKMKIWNGLNSPYQLSLFYQVAPVELESMIHKKTSRVREIRVEEKR